MLSECRPVPKLKRVQRISLGCLTIRNPVRRWCVRLYRSKWLDRFVTLLVFFNSIILGFVDYTNAGAEGPNPNISYNHFIEKFNSISLSFFMAEIFVKIVAKGLIYGDGAYLDDNWNRMDFLIVCSGILTWMNIRVGFIQVLRVIRPLQTLPGFKILTISLLASLPELGNVAILLSLSCIAFAILGMEMWQGQFHPRCRLTPYPVILPFNASYPPSNAYPVNSTYLNAVIANPAWYRCNKSDGTPYNVDESWNTPANCFWPLDSHLDSTIVPRFCVATGNSGRQCSRTMWCGSNYDSDGKPRFLDISGPNMSFSIMSEPVFNNNLNYGFTNFDNLGNTLMIVLQVVTASNWMILTEMAQWIGDPAVAAIFYNALLFLGMCFLLQLNMAVLSTKFTMVKYTHRDFEIATKSYFPCNRLTAAMGDVKICTEQAQQVNGEVSISSAWSRCRVSFRASVRRIVQLNEFRQFGVVATVGNMFVMALNHAEASTIFVYNVEVVNFIFLMYFLVESMLKMIGLGFSNFWTDKFNRIDLITVLLGIIEVFVNPPTFIDGTPGGGGAFTSLRVLRSIKLTRSWKSLNKLLTAMISSVEDIFNFLLFLAIFCYTFALLGMELFATKYQFDPNNHALPLNTTNPSLQRHRSNYDSLPWAAFTVFQMITYDNYPSVLYDGWIAVGWYSPVYHASIIVLGAWIVMHLFSAIVIRACMTDDDGESANPQHNLDMDERPPGHLVRTVCRARRAMNYLVEMLDANVYDPVEQEKHEHAKLFLNKGNSLLLFPPDSFIRKSCVWLLQRQEWAWFISLSVFVSCIFIAIDTPLLDPDTSLGQSIDVFNFVFAIIFSIELIITVIAKGFLAGPDSYVRDAWRLLDGTIVMISILPYFIGSSLTALRALRSIRALQPLRVINKMPQLKVVVNAVFQRIPDILNAVVLFIFWLFIFGLMGVNFFKGAINTCSISPYTYTSGQGTPRRPPWFPVDYSGDYRSNLSDVDIMTYPTTWNKMTSNQQTALLPVWNTSGCGPFADEYQPTSKEICLCFSASNGTSWINQVPQKFDNIFWAIGGLFELTTMEGWSVTAMAGIDAVGEDMQPIVNNNQWMMVWWWIFMIVCAWFITSLFTGILTKSFYQDIYGALVTKEQITWIKLQKRVLALTPRIVYPIPNSKFRAKCFHIVQFQYTQYFITLCIFVNVLAMCMHQYGDPSSLQATLTTMNKIFIGIFVVEAILKLCAFGWAYFEDTWNQIDLTIVLVTLMSIILLKSVKFGRVITVVRVGRVFCFKKTKTMQNLIDTLVLSLPAFGNITSFLMLLFYIYSVFAVQFFAKVALDNQMINEYQNFQNFFRALQALIGFSTGENWANFTWEVYYNQPSTNLNCVDRSFNGSMCGFNDTDLSSCIPLDGCGSWIIVPFMYSFYLIFGFLGMNLYSGIVISAFADTFVYSSFNANVLGDFVDRWAYFDPRGIGLVTAQELVDILYTTSPPFGFRCVFGFTRRRVEIVIGQLDIPIYDGQFVHFKDVPRALLTRELAEGDKTRLEEINKFIEQMGITKQFEQLWHRRRGRKQKEQLLKLEVGSIKEYSASVVIQRFFATSKIQLAYKRSTKKSLRGSNPSSLPVSLPPLNPLDSADTTDNMTAQENFHENSLQSVDPMPFPVLNI